MESALPVCPGCGNQYTDRKHKHCSVTCMEKCGIRRGPVPKGFWSKVDKRTDAECWPWKGSFSGSYGTTWHNGRAVAAHRVAWIKCNGAIPVKAVIRHTCDNPRCVNPNHLLVGSYSDNTQDMLSRGRSNPPRGARNGQAKLNERSAVAIRILAPVYFGNFRALAEHFGVSIVTISSIHLGKTWRHVGVSHKPLDIPRSSALEHSG